MDVEIQGMLSDIKPSSSLDNQNFQWEAEAEVRATRPWGLGFC
jgi:hypothetical protein